MFAGIHNTALRRYVDMRKRVDAEADTIQSLACMLALLQHCNDDRLNIDPMALGHVHQLIVTSVLDLREALDDFIYLVDAQNKLDEEKSG